MNKPAENPFHVDTGPRRDLPIDDRGQRATRGALHKLRRLFQFGLKELMLLVGLLGVWFSVHRIKSKFPSIESEVQRLADNIDELVVLDPNKFAIRRLHGGWENVESWKYYAPEDAKRELRFSTSSVMSANVFPTDFESMALPPGEHTIHIHTPDASDGTLAVVYLDDKVVMRQSTPSSWGKYNWAEGFGITTVDSIGQPIDEPLLLQSASYYADDPQATPTAGNPKPKKKPKAVRCVWIALP